ncbi:hypothetical protein ERN12_14915 [Rhodobacteraceae bacterium]|nr:hypothetical protein ERN12_14915 [Paracoccaceae bacterium]
MTDLNQTGVSASEDIVHYALEVLLGRAERMTDLFPDMGRKWPDVAPVDLARGVMAASLEIEQNFALGSPALDGARMGYRLAALALLELHQAPVTVDPVSLCAAAQVKAASVPAPDTER